MSQLSRKQQTQKRHRRLRRHIAGTSDRPRLAVFRSNNHIYAQVIDDAAQSTLCSASTVDKELRPSVTTGGTCDASVAVGELVAKRALAKGISPQVFDRAFRNASYNPDVIAKDRNQAEFKSQIWDYLDNAVAPPRISEGQAALRKHRRLLDRIEAAYGVEADMLPWLLRR